MSAGSGALVVPMRRGPANAIDSELLATLDRRLDEAERSGRPLVLTGSGRFFCAGLNLRSLPDEREAMGAFLDQFEDLLMRLFLLPCPTVAAVNGHAVAGGALLAAACDVRFGAEGNYRVGVSEVSLGVVFPAIAFQILRSAVPRSRIPEVLLAGHLNKPVGAVGAGFLHELCPAGELLERAVERAEMLGAQPRFAYTHSKRALRDGYVERARARRAACREAFLDTWFSEDAAQRRAAVAS